MAKLDNIHAEAMAEFDRVYSAQQQVREQCQSDRRFYSVPGGQWEGPLSEQFENKPRLEVDKVHLAVMRIINEYRNNRITVNFTAKDGQETDLADTCDGLYRADEQDSMAEEAYDNAFEEAVGGGFGAWRICAEYENEEDEDSELQRLRFEPIYDADSSVFFDIDAKRQDKSDATRCWVIYSQTPEAYKAEWGDDPDSWPKPMNLSTFDWNTPDLVYLAEYYVVERVKSVVVTYATMDGEVKITDPDDDDIPQGGVEIKRRKTKTRKVRKYIMSGGKVLEDCGYIAGKYIPIIPVFGKRWYIDGTEWCMGAVRKAKDPQRLKNMQISKLAEISSLSSVEKPIFLPEQVANHKIMWEEDNYKNYPYLLLDPIEQVDGSMMPAGPIAYTKPPVVPQALAALLQLTEQDMSDILGRQQDGERLLANQSGEAVQLVQNRLDMQSYIYLSNFAKAMQWAGKVWLSMAKEVYTEEDRAMKAIGEMGDIESIALMQPQIDPESGELTAKNDLGRADLDVISNVGPSFSSQRDGVVKTLMSMMQFTSDPQDMKVLQAMMMMNIEAEGMKEIKEYARRNLVQLGVVEPNEAEAKAMEEAGAKPDPNSEYLMAAAAEKQAKAQEAEAKTMNILADTDKKVAETAAIEAETAQPPGA